MLKFRLYFDKDKETAWLNEMAQKGYAMTGFVAGFFHFEKCEPGKYTYQIDFGEKFFSVTEDYREFMNEAGIEIVQTWGFWIILRKLASEGEFKLYTDVDSSIEHYTKIRNMFKVVSIIEIICFMIQVVGAMNGATGAYVAMLIAGICTLVLIRATVKTNDIIIELKERKGEIMEGNSCPRKVSPVLMAGMFMNVAAIAMPETSAFRLPIQIVAIIVMLVGLYQSRNVFIK